MDEKGRWKKYYYGPDQDEVLQLSSAAASKARVLWVNQGPWE